MNFIGVEIQVNKFFLQVVLCCPLSQSTKCDVRNRLRYKTVVVLFYSINQDTKRSIRTVLVEYLPPSSSSDAFLAS